MQSPPEIASIESQLGFQRRFWVAERIGWVAMVGLMLAGLLGLLGGDGPLATAERRVEGVSVTWARFQRLGRSTPLRITLPPGVPAALRPPTGFAALWRLRDTTAGADGRDIALHVEPVGAPGPQRLRLEVAGRMLDLPVFVWP
jgi:multidrug efflux pump subunit AcrA (membrane-fusion protein)